MFNAFSIWMSSSICSYVMALPVLAFHSWRLMPWNMMRFPLSFIMPYSSVNLRNPTCSWMVSMISLFASYRTISNWYRFGYSLLQRLVFSTGISNVSCILPFHTIFPCGSYSLACSIWLSLLLILHVHVRILFLVSKSIFVSIFKSCMWRLGCL